MDKRPGEKEIVPTTTENQDPEHFGSQTGTEKPPTEGCTSDGEQETTKGHSVDSPSEAENHTPLATRGKVHERALFVLTELLIDLERGDYSLLQLHEAAEELKKQNGRTRLVFKWTAISLEANNPG